MCWSIVNSSPRGGEHDPLTVVFVPVPSIVRTVKATARTCGLSCSQSALNFGELASILILPGYAPLVETTRKNRRGNLHIGRRRSHLGSHKFEFHVTVVSQAAGGVRRLRFNDINELVSVRLPPALVDLLTNHRIGPFVVCS